MKFPSGRHSRVTGNKLMNKRRYIEEAFARMPDVEVRVFPTMQRQGVASLLPCTGNIGIELGVASGSFAKTLLDTGAFSMLFGVDAYADTHDTDEFKRAIRHVGLESSHKLLRLTFDEALDLFPDSYFDFVYVDGFAHTGEEGGKTLADWYKKLRPGGILCGDDYHQDWPLVMWAVNHLASQLGTAVSLTGLSRDERYSQYPSWFLRKDENALASSLTLDPRLVEIARAERVRIHRLRTSRVLAWARRLARFAKVSSGK
jgi:SAM-dependent methyltransferase